MKNILNKTTLYCLIFISLIVFTVCLIRPLLPMDETRYAGVAWEMYLNHHWLVPMLNGETYAHKPPLLFWLIMMGWKLMGVNEVWLRIVPALFGFATMMLLQRFAAILWPTQKQVAFISPFILLSCAQWTSWLPLLRFDIILSFFATAALYYLYQTSVKSTAWLMVGVVTGLGILAKGPVILVFTLPAALLSRFWKTEPHLKTELRNIILSLIIAATIALSWAIPAALSGGSSYSTEIFWQQNFGRTVNSFAHARPLWWYLPSLPLLFFPWAAWPPLWSQLKKLNSFIKGDQSVRFLVSAIVPSFIILSLISGKQTRYLFPLIPSSSLLIAYLISEYQKPITARAQWLISLIICSLGFACIAVAWLPHDLKLFAKNPWLHDIPSVWGIVVVSMGAILLRQKSLTLENRVLQICMVCCMLVIVYVAGVTHYQSKTRDTTELAKMLGNLQRNGSNIAFIGDYQDEFQFLGRLQKPLSIISEEQSKSWAELHPNDWIVKYMPQPNAEVAPYYSKFLGDHTVVLYSAKSFLEPHRFSVK